MSSGYFSLLSFHAHRSQAQVCEISEVRLSALRCGTNDDLGQYLCNLRALEGFHVGWRDASPSHSESHVLVRFSSSSVSTAVIQVGKWKGPLLDEYFTLSYTRSISRARLFLDPIGTFQGNCLRCRRRHRGPCQVWRTEFTGSILVPDRPDLWETANLRRFWYSHRLQVSQERRGRRSSELRSRPRTNMTCDVGVRGASGGVEIRDGMDLAWTHTRSKLCCRLGHASCMS